MSKTSVASATTSVVADPESTSKTTQTEWDTFDKAKYGVRGIVCQCLPGHPSDEACKTALVPSAQSVLNHLRAGHGGGFEFIIRGSMPKPWPGWKDLAAAGAEIAWIRDEVTDRQVDVSKRALEDVLKPHTGKFRGAWQAFHNRLLFKIYLPDPAAGASDDSDDYIDE